MSCWGYSRSSTSSGLNACVRAGVSMVVLPRFSVDAVLETIQRHRVSQFAGVPTMLIALLHADTTGFDLTSLRVANSGGAALPSDVLLGIERKFPNLTILEGYGMSETTTIPADPRRRVQRVVPLATDATAANPTRWASRSGVCRCESKSSTTSLTAHTVLSRSASTDPLARLITRRWLAWCGFTAGLHRR